MDWLKFSPDDLSTFQEYYDLPIQGVSAFINGGVSDSCTTFGDDCIGPNWDVQYSMAIAQNVPMIYYNDLTDNFLLNWAIDLLEMDSPPIVNSVSYGSDERYVSVEYAQEFETSAILLSAQGITIIASSGNGGASGFSSGCGYGPDWPATSPYVLAVGATKGPESGSTEVACSSDTGGIITSGGGFSTIYDRPFWQSSAVDGYFEQTVSSGVEPVPGYNVSGAAYPDISSLGYNFEMVVGGSLVQGTGTVSICLPHFCKCS